MNKTLIFEVLGRWSIGVLVVAIYYSILKSGIGEIGTLDFTLLIIHSILGFIWVLIPLFALQKSQETQSQQPLKNSQEFNKSYEVEKMPKKSAITNGEMESSPAHLETSSPADTNHEKPEVKG